MTTMPSLFVSHGAPTFAIEPGLAGARLSALGKALSTPRVIVVVSPHWMTQGIEITATDRPETVHDFGGFPRVLYTLQYPAPGSPELAARVQQQLQSQGIAARLDTRRGLDHGAWVPLLHLYPDARVPVIQVSLPVDTNETKAFALARIFHQGRGSCADAGASDVEREGRSPMPEGIGEHLSATAPHMRRANPRSPDDPIWLFDSCHETVCSEREKTHKRGRPGEISGLGQALAPLAQEGVLVIGSGSLTHNLYEFQSGEAQAASYAEAFCAWVRQAVLDGDPERLLQTLRTAPHAARAHPTTEHFLPLLVAAGAAHTLNAATVLNGGIRHGVLAMESYVFGQEIKIDTQTHVHT